MFQIDSADAVLVKPAKAGPGPNVGGHFRKNDGAGTRGTVLTADWANMLNSELANILAVAGVTQDKNDDTQLEESLRAWPEIAGLISSDTDTGVHTTDHTRVAIAGSGRAFGLHSAAIADEDSEVRGASCATMATEVGRIRAGAEEAAIIACQAANLGELDNEGDASLVAASITGPSLTVEIDDGAQACAIVATANGIRRFNPTSTACAIMACSSASFTDTTQYSAVIASGHDDGGSTADRPIMDGGDYSAIVGVDGDVTVQGNNALVLASSMGSAGATVTDSNVVLLFSGATETIRLESQTGRIECLEFECDDTEPIGAPGAGPTLADKPDVASATADNVEWLVITTPGGTRYIPLWD